MIHDMKPYFSGEKLFGDDFDIKQIQAWYNDEKEGYADLGSKDRSQYVYHYHALNQFHGFRYLGGRQFNKVLGLGAAYGDEFLPITDKIKSITVLDPSDAFAILTQVNGVPISYQKPSIDGGMPFKNGEFDLLTCFSVLHHIPNVSHVLRECYRCLAPSGVMLLHEPIYSMGDWTQPRHGLTKRERGIPLNLLQPMLTGCGFEIVHDSLFYFPGFPRVARMFGKDIFNSRLFTRLDWMLSSLMRWHLTYHRTGLGSALAPRCAFFVLRKA